MRRAWVRGYRRKLHFMHQALGEKIGAIGTKNQRSNRFQGKKIPSALEKKQEKKKTEMSQPAQTGNYYRPSTNPLRYQFQWGAPATTSTPSTNTQQPR